MSNLLFQPQWVQDDDGSYLVSMNEIDLIGYGDTPAIADEMLAVAAIEYAELYLSELDFYCSETVNRGAHFPYLNLIADCNGDLCKVMKIIGI